MPLTEEEKKAYKLKWYKANRSRILIERKKHREDNKESLAKYDRERYKKNKAKYDFMAKRYRENNHDKVSLREWKYRECHKDKIAKYHKSYYSRNTDKVKARARKQGSVSRETLSDGYIKVLIAQKSTIPTNLIPQDLIEFKRQQIILTRTIKEIQKCRQ